MLKTSDIEFNSTVEFEYYAEAIQGTATKNAKVLAILDYDDAFRFINPETTHAAVYAQLPADTPRNPRDFQYLKLRLSNGTITAVGLPWIRESSYRKISISSLNLTIHGVAPSQRALILQALAANGFTAVDMKEVN